MTPSFHRHPSRKRPALAIVGLTALLLIAIALPLGCSDSSNDPEPVTTGTVTGRVTEPSSGDPVIGALVSVSPVPSKRQQSGQTDTNGVYTITGVPQGERLLVIDASGVTVNPGAPSLRYANSSSIITVVAGKTTESDALVPIFDADENVQVQDGQPTRVEPASIPGLVVVIEADAVTFPDGSSTGLLNVVELGFDQGPIPLDEGVAPTMMIRILPEGTTFDPPASITFPNRDLLPMDHKQEIHTHVLGADGWSLDGLATATGSGVRSDQGVGIATAATHYIACRATTVIGTIVDQNQDPLQGADVQVHAWIDEFDVRSFKSVSGATGTTDAEGDFSISGVKACQLSVSAVYASAEGAGELSASNQQLAVDQGTTDLGTKTIQVSNETIFNVEGTVTRQDGSPAVGASVSYRFSRKRGGAQDFANTDFNGHYVLGSRTAPPGTTLYIDAFYFDPLTPEEGEYGSESFVVPPVNQSGATITVDIRICPDEIDPCPEWGDWSLSGSTLSVTLSRNYCGDVETESDTVELLSLSEGNLLVEFEDDGEIEQEVFSRVGGTGPSGVSSANLPGIYISTQVPDFLGIYGDGSINILDDDNESAVFVQYGTYELDGSDLIATFLFSSEPDFPIGEPQTFPYSVSGNTLTIDAGDGPPAVFTRCANSPSGGIQGAWWQEDDEDIETILFYGGEWAILGRQ